MRLHRQRPLDQEYTHPKIKADALQLAESKAVMLQFAIEVSTAGLADVLMSHKHEGIPV